MVIRAPKIKVCHQTCYFSTRLHHFSISEIMSHKLHIVANDKVLEKILPSCTKPINNYLYLLHVYQIWAKYSHNAMAIMWGEHRVISLLDSPFVMTGSCWMNILLIWFRTGSIMMPWPNTLLNKMSTCNFIMFVDISLLAWHLESSNYL